MMRRGYDSDDSEFATAIAASAHAIHAIEEAISQVQIRKTTTRKQEAFRPPQAGSTSKTYSTKDTRNSSFVRPPGDQRQRETSRRLRAPYAKADAWEQAQIAKIRKWYEKLQSEIAAWENEKKSRERHQMARKKAELELRNSRNLKHYHNKVARIEHIAGGAKAQADEKRKLEESIVKEKARKMRATGTAPVSCLCF